MKPMRILHTSDWHLGALLHEQSRLPEQAAFLDWLKQLMATEQPDALIVAGDIFDTCTPSSAALNLYYDFLSATYKENLCRSAVVVGGNHDSPSLLDAPGNVLAHLHTRGVGTVAYHLKDNTGGYVPDYDKEVVVVTDANGQPGLVIGAVPYLRDADLRTSVALETDADRSEKLKRGFKEHYRTIAELARAKATLADGSQLPLILTGHLFLTGGTTADEKSERDLHIGNLGELNLELLPPADYYALGHLHRAQQIGGSDICRYSGAPIPMSFGEIRQTKSVNVIDLVPGTAPVVRSISIPQTKKFAQLKGTPDAIQQQLREHVNRSVNTWVDIQVTAGEGDLTPWWGTFTGIVEDTPVRILRRQNARHGENTAARAGAVAADATLAHLTPEQLFAMRLNDENLTDGEKTVFAAMFAEIANTYAETDTNKE